MTRKYIAAFMSGMLVIGTTALSCAQGPKVKTITIVNGDTTISESNLNDKDIEKLEKQINVTIDGDKKGTKTIVKKIVIDGKEDGDAMAYAFATGDEDDDMEVITNENGKETRIVIKKGDDKGEKGEKGEKKIVKKEVRAENGMKESSNLSVNVNVQGTTAKLAVSSTSKEPLNISILDENGKQVFYETQKSGEKYSKEIPLGKKGTYFLNLIQNKASTMEKIIVE